MDSSVPGSNMECKSTGDGGTGMLNDRTGDFTHVVETYQAVSEVQAMKSAFVTIIVLDVCSAKPPRIYQ